MLVIVEVLHPVAQVMGHFDGSWTFGVVGQALTGEGTGTVVIISQAEFGGQEGEPEGGV